MAADRALERRTGPAAARLHRALRRLTTINSFLQTGAHPDDETSALLARLALGDGVRAGYACATRGEGGQNAIGTESGDALGVLRTLEMEAASRALGVELHWLSRGGDDTLRDFGFARSAERSFAVWGREHLVERLVRVIRRHRPDVVMPSFLDVPGQHGHHRAVTVATIEAFHRAGDAASFPSHAREGLKPWRPAKLYLPAWSGAGETYDDAAPPPAASVTVEAGVLDPLLGITYAQIGERSRTFHRTQGMGVARDTGPHPIALHRLAAPAGMPADTNSPFDFLPRDLGELAATLGDDAVAAPLHEVQAAIRRAVTAQSDPRAVAGELRSAAGELRRAAAALPGRLASEAAADVAARLVVKARQLAAAAREALLPEAPPAPAAVGPARLSPTVSLTLEPRAIVWNLEAPPGSVDLVATLDGAAGVHRVAVDAPAGWPIAPDAAEVSLAADRSARLRFSLGSPRDAAPHRAMLRWRIDGAPARTLTRIIHPDLGAGELISPAGTPLAIMRVKLPGGRIGHVDGGADRVALRLRAIGLAPEPLDPAALRAPGGYDTILVGVGAFGTRADLRAAGDRLADWMRAGGHLVTLYHRPRDGWDPERVPPHFLRIGQPSLRWRVSDPAAPVEHLAPAHPLLNRPNRIGVEDWDGWVRERGLYFAAEWAPAYVPLLAMADPGEARLEGALLSARVGEGRHTHVALALHHQLDALVPGAYRLFANLLAPAR